MSDEIHYETSQYQYAVHHIRCDECNKHICDSAEYSDGYYYNPARFELVGIREFSYLVYNKNLCDDCKKKTMDKFKELLLNFGFEKE